MKQNLSSIELEEAQLRIEDLIKITFNEKILKLISNYFSCLPEIEFGRVYRSFSSDHHLAIPSSSWHKDVNDSKSFVRVFVFLNDVVDENDGPMQYVLKSHSNNLKSFLPLKNYEKNILEDFGRYSSKEILKFYDKKLIKNGLGKKGTVMICDNTGFHRGPIWKKKF